jgi:hypothetical protein
MAGDVESQLIERVKKRPYYALQIDETTDVFTEPLPRNALSKSVTIFYKLKVCGNPESSKSIGAIFPTACAHFVSLYNILVILAIFQTFSSVLYLLW